MQIPDLVRAVAAKVPGVPHHKIKAVLDATLDTIEAKVCEGERVMLYGFGQFQPKTWAPRRGFIPATGEHVDVPAKPGLRFVASNKLRARVADAATHQLPSEADKKRRASP